MFKTQSKKNLLHLYTCATVIQVTIQLALNYDFIPFTPPKMNFASAASDMPYQNLCLSSINYLLFFITTKAYT